MEASTAWISCSNPLSLYSQHVTRFVGSEDEARTRICRGPAGGPSLPSTSLGTLTGRTILRDEYEGINPSLLRSSGLCLGLGPVLSVTGITFLVPLRLRLRAK